MKKILLVLLSFIASSCGQNGGFAPGVEGSSDCNPCKIFVSATETNGNMGGISGADSICANDANNPQDGSTYKAMLSTQGGARIACTSDYCATGGTSEHVDWVLKSNTIYSRVDGTIIGTSNANGLFDFPLTNSFSGSNHQDSWAGFQSQWDQSNINCNNWTSSNGGINGLTGNSGNTSVSVIERGVQVDCGNANLNIYCVEQ